MSIASPKSSTLSWPSSFFRHVSVGNHHITHVDTYLIVASHPWYQPKGKEYALVSILLDRDAQKAEQRAREAAFLNPRRKKI